MATDVRTTPPDLSQPRILMGIARHSFVSAINSALPKKPSPAPRTTQLVLQTQFQMNEAG